MARRRGAILPLVLLALCCAVARHHDAFTGLGAAPRSAAASAAEARLLGSRRVPPAGAGTALLARGGDDDDTIEVSGYSGLVVGFGLLPHVVYILYTAFTVVSQGAALTIGPNGITVVSALTTVGITLWSLGSFVLRGRGLPAGPLGLLGLAEGLSYLGSLAVAAVLLTKGVGKLPTIPGLEGASLPKFEVPAFKAPEFKAPDIKVPDIKAPDIKVPDIKVPEIKAPSPEPKPAPKAEEPKPAPKAEAPKPAPKPEEPKPAPKVEAPKPAPKPEPPKPAPKAEAPKATKAASFADLFDD